MCEIAVMFDEGEMALIQVHADAAGVPFFRVREKGGTRKSRGHGGHRGLRQSLG